MRDGKNTSGQNMVPKGFSLSLEHSDLWLSCYTFFHVGSLKSDNAPSHYDPPQSTPYLLSPHPRTPYPISPPGHFFTPQVCIYTLLHVKETQFLHLVIAALRPGPLSVTMVSWWSSPPVPPVMDPVFLQGLIQEPWRSGLVMLLTWRAGARALICQSVFPFTPSTLHP